MKPVLILGLLFFFNAVTAQDYYTIRYETRPMQEVSGSKLDFFPMVLVIRDTLGYTYYPEVTRRKNLFPLGGSYLAKSSYINTASCIYIFPTGQVEKPKTHRLVVDHCTKSEWTISEETRTIAGYTCKKATGKQNGLEYTAWFTSDLPAGFGPFLMHSLPGTVLEYWHEKGMSYTTAVEIKHGALEIVEPNYCKRISRAEYDKKRQAR